uniref:VWFA domain-containing protein n=1 Tax=Meloidogyne hapla TaxID=6305 RepID=A0A1I8AWX7_MELHA
MRLYILVILLIIFTLSFIYSVPQCQFGECSSWDILLLPLLTDKFTQVSLLKAIVRSMLCGCRWYFHEQIKIELATKNGSFVHVKDPISFPEFEQLDQFKFTQTERQSNNNSQWKKCVNKALANIGGDKNITNITTISNNSKQEERGRFVFVITDFERRNGNEKDFLQDIDQNLAENGVFFRYVRLKFDDHKQTQITTGGGKSSTINERIRNISSNIIRVAIVEQGSDFDAFVIVRPCPQLNDAEKIREYS